MKDGLDLVLGDEPSEQALVEDVTLDVRVVGGQLVGKRSEIEGQEVALAGIREPLDEGRSDFTGRAGDQRDFLAHGSCIVSQPISHRPSAIGLAPYAASS